MKARNAREGFSPAFMFYPSDWRSPRVRKLSRAARDLYHELLCDEWREGSIPADERELFEQAGVRGETFEDFLVLWKSVAQFFEPAPGKDGRLANPRMEREREIQEKYRRAKAQAGRAGGVAKASRIRQTSATDSPDVRQESASGESVTKRSSSPAPALSQKERKKDAHERDASLNGQEPDRPRLVTRREKTAAAAAEKQLQAETVERWQMFELRRSSALERAGERGGVRPWPGVAKALAIMAREQEQPAEPAKRPA